ALDPNIESPIVIHGLASYNGDLIAAGEFNTTGGVAASNIARWDGTAWHPLGTGLGGSSADSSMCVFAGKLIVGGSFATAGGSVVRYVAEWDGATWSPLAGGVDGPVNALTVYHGRLVVGGDFVTA